MAWGPWQIIIVLAIVALLFGSKKLPEIARSLGRAKGEFRKGAEEGERLLREEDEGAAKLQIREKKKEDARK